MKITYILGAGASAPLLPLAVDPPKSYNQSNSLYGLATAMINLAGEFETQIREHKKNHKQLSEIKLKFFKKTIPQLRNLAEDARNFSTIDTLAKYYYITEKNKLPILKQHLAKYFLIEQLIKKKFNNKYLVFLTTILSKEQFPSHIKILNWNYDYQLGIAASKFTHEDFTTNGRHRVINKPLIPYFPDVSEQGWMSNNTNCSMVYLNGIAGLYKSAGTENPYANHIYNEYSEDTKMELIEKILPQTSKYLTFAWEKSDVSIRSLEIAKRIIIDTEILVVIGYSFPFFNREIDRAIFEILKQNHNLKIYFQNPQIDGKFLVNQFNLKESIYIKHISKVDQFYIPFEL